MKTQNYTLKNGLLYTAIFIAGAAFTSSCDNSKANNKPATTVAPTASLLDIPALFERKGELAKADDWAKTQEKVAELNLKLQQNARDVKTRLKLVTIYLAEARITGEHPYYYPAILRMVDGILSIEPQNFEALTYKASVLMSQHKFVDALQVAESVQKINPDNAYIYGILVDANVELGNYETAVEMSDKMQALKPSLESYSRASYLREIYGDYKGSIDAMVMAVQAGLPGSEPYCWSKKTLGYLYEQTGDYKLAEKQYVSILAERPSYAFALEGLARVEKQKKNYDQALKYLNEAIAVMPEFSFHEEIADIYVLQGKEAEAKEKYNEVIKMLHEDAAAGHITDLDLSKVFLKAGNADSAAVYAEKEYKIRPENIDVLRTMAEVSLKKNDFTAANEYLTKASRTGSKNPELIALASEIKEASKTAAK